VHAGFAAGDAVALQAIIGAFAAVEFADMFFDLAFGAQFEAFGGPNDVQGAPSVIAAGLACAVSTVMAFAMKVSGSALVGIADIALFGWEVHVGKYAQELLFV
jgi:hypothetical protein